MLAPSRSRALVGSATTAATATLRSTPTTKTTTLPGFLVPAFTYGLLQGSVASARQFSATAERPSKLGRIPLSIPPGVELTIGEPKIKKDMTTYLRIPRRTVTVQGPLGTLNLEIPPFVNLNHDSSARRLRLSVEDSTVKQQMEMWGTTWRYLDRYLIGVSEGHTAVLRLVGIGYRAWMEDARQPAYENQKTVVLKLGFTHNVEMPVPKGIAASVPQPTRIALEGIDREAVMSFAAQIRRWRVPEPYKGKGIFVDDETIKLKQKKIK